MSGQGIVDLFVIGGGVNGVGIARDAAGRGLSVMLCEKDDLAQGTSSRSGKLIHGGLRYLEYYEFRLVREALIEREVLLRNAPHIIWPMRFVLPHSPDDRPAWLVRLGLFLYDHLGGRRLLPGTRVLDLASAAEGQSIRSEFRKAFEFSDCWVDDARLVVLNALDAHERGAKVHTRTACVSARRKDGLWQIEMQHLQSGVTTTLRARALVNAAGPWVNDVITRIAGANTARSVRLVKGSHIVVPKFWDGPQAYVVQNVDRRIIFINPYEGDKALIGTTDTPYAGRPEDVCVDDDEIDYLLKAVSRYFKQPPSRGEVIHSFSGVRPLYDDHADNPSAVTRDYIFELDAPDGAAPLLSVFGGKITTFRKLAEHGMGRLKRWFPAMGGNWTQSAPLPGGDIPAGDVARFQSELASRYPCLPVPVLQHYARCYGTRAYALLGEAASLSDLGRQFGATFYECEAQYLKKCEWAVGVDDILERRTKHGLRMSAKESRAFATWFTGAVAKAS